MNDRARPPADMLILRERAARLGAAAPPERPTESLLLEPDTIVDVPAGEIDVPRAGVVTLFRPLASVTLAHASWTGAIDHEMLQDAIACSAPHDASESGLPTSIAGLTTTRPSPRPDEPALCVAIGPDELSLLEKACASPARASSDELVRAAVLPSTIVGAEAPAVDAAATILTAYRRAALVYAWQRFVDGEADADSATRRDAAAAQLLSVVRALLGEA